MEFLRDDLKLKGAVEGCSVRVCGSCTVLIDGEPISSCLTLASNIEGKEVTTIEGLSIDGQLDPVRQAFLKHQAFQCGFCTTGMIMARCAVNLTYTANAIRLILRWRRKQAKEP